MLDLDDDKRESFLMGLVNVAMAKIRYEVGNAARVHFQDTVFCLILRKETFQKELGFNYPCDSGSGP